VTSGESEQRFWEMSRFTERSGSWVRIFKKRVRRG
jgi:hypothetical protein